MTHRPNRRERRSLRLPDYDYRRGGYYFVTICVDDREPRLGRIVDGRMEWTEAGRMVDAHWPPFDRRLWQRNYDERVIRNEAELDQIRAYIRTNPCRERLDDCSGLNSQQRFGFAQGLGVWSLPCCALENDI